MIGIGTAVKWGTIALVAGMLATGVNAVRNYHLDQIDEAVISSKRDMAIASATRLRDREEELRSVSREDKLLIEMDLAQERAKVTDLRRMLLVEHDLDRLLQSKPDMVLKIVNTGTVEYFQELEEVTQ